MGKAARKETREAVQRRLHPVRLLNRDESRPQLIEDAAHWVSVYSEILRLQERLEDTPRTGPMETARGRIHGTDPALLAAKHDRLRRRLDYWRDRLEDLSRELE